MTPEQDLDTIPRLDFADLPMVADRAAGWAVLRDAGLVAGRIGASAPTWPGSD
ncbi:hypothetical protein ORI20_21710 [Mycobacterium sp. CVI_P3]|uniref:Uncharacterized protein n=1 Tax=Mycobacterium pinniadriaticum TaxID=2994102 RepID=A0ABT3SIG8_9MYCO|nr:hypothetical protein [Mycobacterium pinniadriaticum]MCX2932891.1 hypothetical protein [Mycobacterium pinniadriaticum]MCX2939314.1 hypothetical protein [Mycobacterium pinniadriaticum]